MDLVDTPYYLFHSMVELLVLADILDLDGETVSPEIERIFGALSPEQRRSVPKEFRHLLIHSKSDSDDPDGDSDEADDDLSEFEGTAIYPDIGSAVQMKFDPLADGDLDNTTVPPGNTSPNLHSYTNAEDSTQDFLGSVGNKDLVTYESLSSQKTTVKKTDRTARKPTMLELGAQSKSSSKKYVPSPLSQAPMMADAGKNDLVNPKTPIKSTLLRRNIVNGGEMQIRQPSEGLLDLDANSRSENRGSVKLQPEIAKIEELNTLLDSFEGNAISYTVPFRDQIPPSAQSYGKTASKVVKEFFGKGKHEEKSVGDDSLPSCGEVPGEPNQPSDASRQSRKRRASSTSSRDSKRSRSSSNSVKVSGRRLPLLFTLATSGSGVEHRHVVIPLPISWPRFLHMAVEAFGRESCGQETPTEVSEQARYVMKWNKPVTRAHGDSFPTETELCRENINAVLQWMLYSGSYDFCEIHDTQTAESTLKDGASCVMSENKPREEGFDGSMVVATTTLLGSKDSHETACNVPNSARECEDQSQKDTEPVDNPARAAADIRSAELTHKPEQNAEDNAVAEGRESVGIKGNSMTETGVNVDRKGG
ncbi:MAG: hypothetical protein HETSPECPRED_003892 [Heterodermia speciosa]|uniref:Uncharacterized protein n=1 Tax=Heterodermia speciosa TaxID=116794 RepID=A0A8H3FDP5_9LECA|nr:MAG: hypothetical protein HETSPECPRED_003892 [Heterodermia speciosa]